MVFFTIIYILIILGLFGLIAYGYYKDYQKTPGYFKFTLSHLGKYFLIVLAAMAVYFIIMYFVFW